MEGRVDRYLLFERLGTGATGAVYRARHATLDRECAVKVLHQGMLAHPEDLARFEREAAALGRMRHPNVVDVTDFGTTTDDTVFLVMEYVSGAPLSELIQAEAPLQEERVISITCDILAGLAHAHGRGFVHRDLKPANILIVPEGSAEVARLLDFGLVTNPGIIGLQADLTEPGAFMGTPLYMSPEQIRGDPTTPAVDLYALGVVIYEMVTGEVPFRAPRLAPLMQLHLHEPPPALPPESALADVVAALLQKDPLERPSSAAEVLARLERARTAPPSASSPKRTLMLPLGLASVAAAISLAALAGLEKAVSPPPGARIELASAPDASLANDTGAGATSGDPVAIAKAAVTSLAVTTTADAGPVDGEASDAPAVGTAKVSSSPRRPQRKPALRPRTVNVVTVAGGEFVVTEVYVDGRRAGETPMQLELTPGSHTFEVNGPDGWRRVTKRIPRSGLAARVVIEVTE